MYQLEKTISLIKPEYDQLNMEVFNGFPRLERSMYDLNDILFYIRYMSKYQRDLMEERLPEAMEELRKRNAAMKESWSLFLRYFMLNIVGFEGTDFTEDDLYDIFLSDLKLNGQVAEFSVVILSESLEYLNYVDSRIPEGRMQIYPTKFFRYNTQSYNEAIELLYPERFEQLRNGKEQRSRSFNKDDDVFVHNFTFQTTENCNLNCTYCYQLNKTASRMDFETARKFIDNLLADKYTYINSTNSPALIIEFIGGDPLLEIDLTRRIYEYFLDQTFKLRHPWFTFHRLSICTNGMLYFDPVVQEFFGEFADKISFNISIDGNRELHDSCRVQPNGEGSYDIDIIALNHFNSNYSDERNSKMTLSDSNIHYLYDSVVDFINQGMYAINLNCIFEDVWSPETARVEYEQLKKLADYLIENDLENLYIAIFTEIEDRRNPYEIDGNYCGGLGSMLVMGPDGTFYPCLRYMPSSVGNDCPSAEMGNVRTGMVGRQDGSEILRIFGGITRRSQSNDICYDCPINSGCSWCSGLCYQTYGTADKRTMFICVQMIAEALANVYYWNKLILAKPEYDLPVRRNNVPDEWALKIISEDELRMLKELEREAERVVNERMPV